MNPGDLSCICSDYAKLSAKKIKRFCDIWFRPTVTLAQPLPEGPCLYVGNHSGATLMPDMFTWLSHYYALNSSTTMAILTNPSLFSYYPKALATNLAKMGAIRANSRLAIKAIESGYSVQVYPGGDQDACRSFRDRNKIVFANNVAYAKLAKRLSIPIVPVVSMGGHDSLCILWDGVSFAKRYQLKRRIGLGAFPLSLCLPWGIWLGPIPGYIPLPRKITIQTLAPIFPEGDAHHIDTMVREQMQGCLNNLVLRKKHCSRSYDENLQE